ncbi:MAG: DUF3857 domain-containing protein, partial [Candidatus Omnitrophica bacterium]|nr:DUF3857 domain-containing protein [Candidatus Omnitrophota bacterium]
MPIINTFRGKALLVNLLGLVLIIFASGCSRHTSESTPAELAKKSGDYYREALAAYNNALARSRDAEKLRFELGRLYFEHGDFTSAIAEFKKTDSPQAKKLLAISLYKKGDFADALEAFSHNELKDDESLYFYGLTAEKLNLFDEALKAYLKINSASLKQDVRVRIEAIEKEAGILHIKEADPKVYAIIKDAPTLAEYPQAGALILYCDETIEITPDNRQISVLHYLVKILNERGKEKFSETHVDYDSTYEKVKLVYARTIRPDGRVVDVGARHIRDVSRYLNFPLYSNARAYIISFPEIAEGSIIEYKVILHNNRLINEKDFMTAYMLQDDEPIIAANFTLRLPIDRGIHLKTVNERYNDFDATLSPVVKQEGNFMVYKWQFKNIPQIIPEPSMPPMAEVNPTFFVSTFNSWDDIYKWWWGLASGKMNLDSQIRDKVRELTRNKKTEKEKAAALYNFCAQKIRYVAVEYGQAG